MITTFEVIDLFKAKDVFRITDNNDDITITVVVGTDWTGFAFSEEPTIRTGMHFGFGFN